MYSGLTSDDRPFQTRTPIRFMSIGGGSRIGANCHYLELDNVGLLLDCGVNPSEYGVQSLPEFDLIGDRIVENILVSHCHTDHIGALPPAMSHFPRSRILMSYPSSYLYETVLHSNVAVMKKVKEEKGIEDYPLYEHIAVDMLSYIVQGYKFEKPFKLYSYVNPEGIEGRFFEAGHVLGAAGVLLESNTQSVFFSGDTCLSNQWILGGAAYPAKKVDVLIMETTLAGGDPLLARSRKKEIDRLSQVIRSALVEKQGSVLIPAFALGKSQEILTAVSDLRERGRIPNVDIYITDSSKRIGEIYDSTMAYTSRVRPDRQLADIPCITLSGRDLRRDGPWLKRPSIIIATSGMMFENTPSNLLAQRMIEDQRHTICFVGYIPRDTVAHEIRVSSLASAVKLEETLPPFARHCDVETFHFTAHSQKHELLKLVETLEPKHLVLVHGGAENAVEALKEELKNRNPKMNIVVPEIGSEVQF